MEAEFLLGTFFCPVKLFFSIQVAKGGGVAHAVSWPSIFNLLLGGDKPLQATVMGSMGAAGETLEANSAWKTPNHPPQSLASFCSVR